ncbi:MAG: hypothetical protein KGD65_12270 [Candidatus Lokiarchaeota archaeon]|nr:hypothetical protein [Candidatus Lokiarchaeota archaeon]
MEDQSNEFQQLKDLIHELKLELTQKNQKINDYIEIIQDNEEELMKLHELILKNPSHENIQELIESKYIFDLKEKEREIRDLKNRMGFLRKERIAAQRDLEEIRRNEQSSAINIELIREKEKVTKDLLNLETTINELRKKHYLQELLIANFKKEIGEKDKQVKELNTTIMELNKELVIKKSILSGNFDKNLKKELNKRLQNELLKYKELVKDLREKLIRYKKSKGNKIEHNIEVSDLKNRITLLKKELESRNRVINDLRSQK